MDIIKKLQFKFIIIVVLILTLVFTSILIGINQYNLKKTESISEIFLQELINHDGIMPNPKKAKEFGFPSVRGDFGHDRGLFQEPFETQNIRNYFSVKISKTGEIISIVSEFPLHYTEDEIVSLVNAVFSSNNHNSTYEGIRYLIAPKSYGYLAVFSETRIESNIQSRLFNISFVIFIISLVFSIFVAWLLSIWAIKPVIESIIKQRRFVSDASHELKTPLSVISANMDVLVSEVGENKWATYIQNEIERMGTLIKDLLYLAKSDDGKTNFQMTTFDLSRSIMSLVLPFEAKVYESGKNLQINIQENVSYVGVQKQIEQLVAILLDNAIKYSEEKAEIKLTLKTSGNKKIISVYNSGAGIPEKNQRLIFERFYRLDDSRNRDTGGFGLGLAIAKNIVDLHKGKIQLSSKIDKYTEFTVIL